MKNAENAYIELSELYNWDKIECIKDNELRSIEDINEEIYNIVTDNIEVATDKLINKANENGGLDNITVIIVLNKNNP